jgi:phage shock protein PspC (stress-responsive transcriptional regulator)
MRLFLFEQAVYSLLLHLYPNHMEQKILYRSRKNSVIGGVCGGLGDYLNTDPVVFRVLFLVALLIGGSGLLVYIILWIAIPEEKTPIIGSSEPENYQSTENESETNQNKTMEPEKKEQKNDGNLWGGLILITLGAIFLIDRFVPRIDFGDLWPVILIVVGIILITKSYQQPKN